MRWSSWFLCLASVALQTTARGDDGRARWVLQRLPGHSALATRDGKLLITHGWDVSPRLWDVATGREIRSFEGHLDAVHAACLSPDETLVATGSADATARIWNLQSGKCLQVLRETDGKRHALPWLQPKPGFIVIPDDRPPPGIGGVAFLKDGKRLATLCGNGVARMWDISTGKEISSFAHEPLRNPAGAEFANDGAWLVDADREGAMRVWNTEDGRLLHAFKAGPGEKLNERHHAWVSGQILSAKATGNRKHLLLASESFPPKLCDPASGKILRIFEGHAAPLLCVDLNPEGTLLLSADKTPEVRLWDVSTGKTLLHLPFGKDVWILNVAFADEGRLFLIAGTGIRPQAWDVKAGAKLHELGEVDDKDCRLVTVQGKVAYLRRSDYSIVQWDLQKGTTRQDYARHAAVIRATAVAGDRLVTAGIDGRDLVWDLKKGNVIRCFEEPPLEHQGVDRVVALSRDGCWLISGRSGAGKSGETARLIEVSSGKTFHQFEELRFGLHGAAFSPDASLLAIADDESLRLWDVKATKLVRTDRLTTHNGSALAFSSDGKFLATGGTSLRVALQDVKTGEERCTFDTKRWFEAAAFDPTGRYLFGALNESPPERNDDLPIPFVKLPCAKLWDVQAKKEIRSFVGHRRGVVAMALSRDGKHLYTGSRDGTARKWNASDAELVREFRSHPGELLSIILVSEDRRLLTSGDDGCVRIWDTETGKECCRLACFKNGAWAVYDDEGRFDRSEEARPQGLHLVRSGQVSTLESLEAAWRDPGLLAKHLGLHAQPLRPIAKR